MQLRHPEFQRITIDSSVCSGKPCIRGIRFPVATLLGYLAGGMAIEDILSEFPFLEKEDILQSLAFAAAALEDKFIPLEQNRA